MTQQELGLGAVPILFGRKPGYAIYMQEGAILNHAHEEIYKVSKLSPGVVKDYKVVAVRIEVAASNQDLGLLGTIHYLCEFDTYELAIRASTDRERAYSLGKALQDLFYGVAAFALIVV